MIELSPCPFCGGKAHLKGKVIRFFGQNYYGDKKIRYGMYGYCGRCKARGGLFAATLVLKGGRFTPDDKNWLGENAIKLWEVRNEN